MVAAADIGLIGTEDLSLKHRFSLPNKLFEYLIGGIPIVATNMPGHVAVIDEHGVGRTCEPAPEPFARAIVDLDQEIASKGMDALRARCREAGRRYTWDEEGKRYMAVVEGVLAGR